MTKTKPSQPEENPFPLSQPPVRDLSIVIVSFNTREILLDCLESVYTHTRDLDFEILVVDNHSADGSAEAVERKFPDAGLIKNEENRGFSAACNQAIRLSRGRYIVLLNSDTLLTENDFLKIIRFLDDHPQFSILSPRVLNSNGHPLPMRLREDTPWEAMQKVLGRYDPAPELKKMALPEPREVEVVGGACFFIRRSLLEAIGLLDENYFLYNEEDDFCRRARRNGHKICFFPNASIRHLQGKSTHQPPSRERVILETYKSNLYFYAKHYSRPWNWVLRSLYILTFLMGIGASLARRITGQPLRGADDSISLKFKLLWNPAPGSFSKEKAAVFRSK